MGEKRNSRPSGVFGVEDEVILIRILLFSQKSIKQDHQLIVCGWRVEAGSLKRRLKVLYECEQKHLLGNLLELPDNTKTYLKCVVVYAK